MTPPERRRGQGGDARSKARTCDLDRGKLRPMLGDGEADSSWSGRLLPAFGEQLLVGRWREFLAGRVPPAGVVVLDLGRDRSPGLRPGGEVLQRPQLELYGGVPRFDDRVIESGTRDGPWTGRWKAASRPAGGPGGVLGCPDRCAGRRRARRRRALPRPSPAPRRRCRRRDARPARIPARGGRPRPSPRRFCGI